jgi:hypothetical protein
VSSPQPPYGAPQVPPPYSVYQKPLPRRRRPSAWWFAVAALLMLAGIAIGVFLIVQTVAGFLKTDVTVDVDGQPHVGTVPTDGDRMLWIDETLIEPSCEIVDTETGEVVELDEPGATYTRGNGKIGDALGTYTFDPGSGRLQVTCTPEMQSVVEIGPAPEFGRFFGGLAAGILIPLLFGGAGFVMLIVVAVLYATGRPRDVPAPQ